MILFTFPDFTDLSPQSKQIEAGKFSVKHYHNLEPYIEIDSKVKDKDCAILGTIAPPENNLVEFCLLAEVLKKEGAKKITAILPYLAYSRQDKSEINISFGAQWVGSVLENSGINKIITIDVHSDLDISLFPHLKSISATELYADLIDFLTDPDVTIVSPDKGGLPRVKDLIKKLANPRPPVYLEKIRTNKIKHLNIIGYVSPKVLIYDDILDSGATLVSACKILTAHGVEEIQVAITHGQFIGNIWKDLFKLGVSRIYTTDSVPIKFNYSKYPITVISIKDLLSSNL